eukprot:scaffold4482_cov133-Isochrysis_galbana.AAC.6
MKGRAPGGKRSGEDRQRAHIVYKPVLLWREAEPGSLPLPRSAGRNRTARPKNQTQTRTGAQVSRQEEHRVQARRLDTVHTAVAVSEKSRIPNGDDAA